MAGRDRRGARRVRGAGVGEPGAARGLRDADRQPRRRDAARARGAARRPISCSARTRGTRGCCSTGTGSRRGCSRSTSTTRPSGSRELMPRLEAGERIALVSDAGLPGISDPGTPLVRAALAAGRCRDGAARALGGRDGARRERARRRSGTRSSGFLPRRAAELAALWEELGSWAWPVVAFESPRRLPATLRSLAAAAPAREVAVCRELTKRFEEVVRGTAAELAERFAEAPKGEITLVLGPALGRRRRGAARRGGAARGRARRRRHAAQGRGRGRLPADGRRPQRPLPRRLCDNSVICIDNGRPTV